MEISEIILPQSNPFVVGVVSDTHIPDRVKELHPFLLDELKKTHVQLILHAGDISIGSVLTALETIAPVRAVTGNRDILLSRQLPAARRIEIYGSSITLIHGHLGLYIYWKDKINHILQGYSFSRYQKRFDKYFPQSRVIVFGHTHHIENQWIDGRLYFNPGSVSHGDYLIPEPHFGLLKFYEDGRIESSLIPLQGAAIRAKRWEIIS